MFIDFLFFFKARYDEILEVCERVDVLMDWWGASFPTFCCYDNI